MHAAWLYDFIPEKNTYETGTEKAKPNFSANIK